MLWICGLQATSGGGYCIHRIDWGVPLQSAAWDHDRPPPLLPCCHHNHLLTLGIQYKYYIENRRFSHIKEARHKGKGNRVWQHSTSMPKEYAARPFIHASKAQGKGTLRLTLFCTFFYHHNMEQEGKPASSITFLTSTVKQHHHLLWRLFIITIPTSHFKEVAFLSKARKKKVKIS